MSSIVEFFIAPDDDAAAAVARSRQLGSPQKLCHILRQAAVQAGTT
jgi:hypothetical protein